MIVIDDDPTGTQTVAGLRVILRPSPSQFADFFASNERTAWVLSNSRALGEEAAAALVSTLADRARAAAADAGVDLTFVLRGDSTLRGYVFAEAAALDPGAAVVFVPAFLEGGRVTRDGVHLLATEDGWVPVASTEFARDPDFAYTSVALTDWVTEVTGGRYRAVTVPSAQLRAGGIDGFARVLLSTHPHRVVIPDVDSSSDLAIIAGGIRAARRRGARIVVRCAASLAAVLAGSHARPLESIRVREPGRLLVVCGSFTEASTRQLQALGALWQDRVELATGILLDDPDRCVRDAVATTRRRLASDGVAVVASQRDRGSNAGREVATAVMDALVAVVAGVAADVDVVISKGGITSARVATDGLAASHATVIGQPLPGVALWQLARGSGHLPLVVVPGNVGADNTLALLVARLAPEPAQDQQPTCGNDKAQVRP